jgi:hypothetical protein
MIKMVLMIILTLIGLILFGAIVFGFVVYTRIILYPPVETVGEWKTLSEESKV